MKVSCLFTLFLFLLTSCTERKNTPIVSNIDQQLRSISDRHAKSVLNGDFKTFLSCYDRNAICMPEYQPTLQGLDEIEVYFKELFIRQKIKSFEKRPEEIIDLDSTLIEIGSFTKEYSEMNKDSTIVLDGKYWNVWTITAEGSLKLKGECFGYFHAVQNPASFVVPATNDPKKPLTEETPFELLAYNALMEKGVRDRDGDLRARFFTSDGMFMPFQEPTVKGIEKIKPYLASYSNRGQVKIDSIEVYPYHFEYFGGYVLEYPEFYVEWKSGAFAGTTAGKGIRIWKRQKDNSLKIFREIGTHNHQL